MAETQKWVYHLHLEMTVLIAVAGENGRIVIQGGAEFNIAVKWHYLVFYAYHIVCYKNNSDIIKEWPDIQKLLRPMLRESLHLFVLMAQPFMCIE